MASHVESFFREDAASSQPGRRSGAGGGAAAAACTSGKDPTRWSLRHSSSTAVPLPASASEQGLTLVHFSAQRKRFMWDRGCMYGVF